MRTAAWYISNLSGPRRLATHRLGTGCRGSRSRAFESSQAGLCHDAPLLQTHQLNFSWQTVTMFFFSFLSCHLWKRYCSYWAFPPCGYTPQPGLMVHPKAGNLLKSVLELAIFHMDPDVCWLLKEMTLSRLTTTRSSFLNRLPSISETSHCSHFLLIL